MTTILQDITAIVGDETGLPISLWRDDDLAPFKNLSQPCLLIRNQSGSADKDIAQQTVDIWFFSKAQGSQQDMISTLNACQALEDFFHTNFVSGRIYDIQILGSTGAPLKDGQGRWAVPLNIQVRRSTGVSG